MDKALCLLLLLAVVAALALLLLGGTARGLTLPSGTTVHVPRILRAQANPDAVDLPPLSAHALEHGEDAQAAWNWVRRHGRTCRWDCPDGRTRYVCGMPKNIWAIVVVEGGDLVTAFTGDQDYAKGATEGCRNGYWYGAAHP
jgi:hypothetical protein